MKYKVRVKVLVSKAKYKPEEIQEFKGNYAGFTSLITDTFGYREVKVKADSPADAAEQARRIFEEGFINVESIKKCIF